MFQLSPVHLRKTAIAMSVLMVAVTTLSAVSTPVKGAFPDQGETINFPQIVYIGRDREFTQPTSPAPGYTQYYFNYGYLGIDEGTGGLSCLARNSTPDNNPSCTHNIPYGFSRSWMFLREIPVVDPDARAGVGVAYELRKGCDGQQVPTGNDRFKVVYDYHRTATITNTGGLSYAEIWANPIHGRGDLTTGEALNGENKQTETQLAASSPSTAKSFTYTTAIPTEGNYKALLYSHAHAQRLALTRAQQVEIKVDMTLDRLKLDFVDTQAPTTTREVWATNVGEPVYGYDGRYWFSYDLVINIDAEDDFSCPKTLYWRDNGGAYQTRDINWWKDTQQFVYDHNTLGKWDFQYYAEDYQGNKPGTPTTYRFGMDRDDPVASVEVTPADPTGLNGWYKTKPSIKMTCTDATAGCHHFAWRYGWWDSDKYAYANPYTISSPSEGDHMFSCDAFDNARKQSFGGCYADLKIDTVAPRVSDPRCKALNGPYFMYCSSGWYTQPVDVELNCDDFTNAVATSGCWIMNYTIDSGPKLTYSTPFRLDTDGDHTIAVEYLDRAGNKVTGSFHVKIDQTAPTTPVVAETHDKVMINVDPSWTFTSTDATSGLKDYMPTVDGTDKAWQTGTSYTLAGASDGNHCLKARARDNALNVGPASNDVCVLVDKTPPVLDIWKPKGGTVYRNDQPIVEATGPIAIALGRISLQTTASDPDPANGAPKSGLVAHYSLLSGDPHWRGVGNNQCALDGTMCEQTFYPADPFSTGLKTFTAVARDGAGNEVKKEQVFDYVNLVALSGKTEAGIPYVRVEWMEIPDATGFVGYELHRAPIADFTPNLATKVFSSSDPDTVSFRDKTVVTESTYYYKVVYITEVGGVTMTKTSNEYPARPSTTGIAAGKEQFLERGYYRMDS